MLRIKLFLMFIALMLLLAACSQENTNEVTGNDTPENTEEIEEEQDADIPSDAELIAVIEEHIRMIDSQDIEGYMKTLHTDTNGYEELEAMMSEAFSAYDFNVELTEVSVEEKGVDEAKVLFSQITRVEGPDFNDNMVINLHTLRPEGRAWKIYATEEIEAVLIDENGEPIEDDVSSEVEEDYAGYQYTETIMELNLPIADEGDWYVQNYEEDLEEAYVVLLPDGQTIEENTEFMGIHYYWNGEEVTDVSSLLDFYLEDLNRQMGDQNFDFEILDELETSIVYLFKLETDDMNPDMLELGRAFAKDGDLYVIRYAAEDLNIDIDERIEFLNSLN